MIHRKANIHWMLILACIVGLIFFETSIVCANDETQGAYEITYTCDTLICNDSIFIIQTICAPICSSHARIYNKEWQLIGFIKPPFKSAFPLAYIEDGRILWRDNDNFDYTQQR